MSWWKKLLGSSKKQHTSELRFPLVIEIVPGALSAMVYSHKLSPLQGEILCWSYVSKGLEAVEHPEVVITLRREANEPEDAFPGDPLQLFKLFHQLAGQGKRVGPGEVSELGDNVVRYPDIGIQGRAGRRGEVSAFEHVVTTLPRRHPACDGVALVSDMDQSCTN